MQEFLTGFMDFLGLAWWVEIKTESPRCIYYFGPFQSSEEAETEKSGYVEDLQAEGAQNIAVVVKRCKPTELTISDEVGEFPSKVSPSFSSPIS
ncbi:MAG: DUF1816 domain-containing protein [Leptolyngbyaceae cyanobacterium bins.302]|nr:DUF1816 domain-containing protein [Leptolyngbyaceae cyanobacterium bins.302]